MNDNENSDASVKDSSSQNDNNADSISQDRKNLVNFV